MNDFKQILSRIKRESRIKECFHANNDCSSSIIKAHSVQNNRILSQLAENGLVLQLKPSYDNDEFSIQNEEIGRKVATVSTDFCGSHDSKIFRPIQSKDYQKNNKEQEFLFAYRALSKEYHVKQESKKFYEEMQRIYGEKSRNLIEGVLKGTNSTLEQVEKEKVVFNNALSNSAFEMIGTHTIEFHGFYGIAASTTFAIECDLQGNIINDLGNLDKDLKFIFLNIIPQNNRTFILMSFLRKDRKIFSFIPNQIMKKSISDQKLILSNLLLSHVENLILSPRLWRKISAVDQNLLKSMLENTITSSTNRLSNLTDINLFIEIMKD